MAMDVVNSFYQDGMSYQLPIGISFQTFSQLLWSYLLIRDLLQQSHLSGVGKFAGIDASKWVEECHH